MSEGNWGGAREGAGRKKNGIVYKTFSVSLPSDEEEVLRQLSEKEGLTVSRFISESLALYQRAEKLKKREM